MLLPHGTIVVLVDGEKFELYCNSGDEAQPHLDPQPVPKLDEHNMGSGGHHQSSSANPDGGMLLEDAHAAGVASYLNKQATIHAFKHVIVIAAPRTLGELRRHYNRQLQDVLLGEVHKDYCGRPVADILKLLQTSK